MPIRRPVARFGALTSRQHLGQFGEVRHLDRVMGVQQRRGRSGVARRPAGVGRHGAPGTLVATDLQRDNRLAHSRGAVEGGDEAIGLPDGLDE